MATKAIIGTGTIFRRWNGSQWESIAEINSITGPSMGKEIINVTSLGTETGYSEFITGFINGGDVSLIMNFTRDTYELMMGDYSDDERRFYQILFPDVYKTAITFGGFVNEAPMELSADDKVKSTVSIKITGQVDVVSYESLYLTTENGAYITTENEVYLMTE